MPKITEKEKQLFEAIGKITEKGLPEQMVFVYPDGEKLTFKNSASETFRRYIIAGFLEECRKKDEEEK